MKKILISATLAAFALMTGSVMAQSKGEADPAQSKAAPSAKASKEEKAAARAARKSTGKEVEAKAMTPGAADEAANKSAGKAKVATKEEKAAAKAKRKVEASAALKKGEIPSGDKPMPEPKK